MRTSLPALFLIVAVIASTGCVSQQQYDELNQAWRRSQEQVASMQNRIAELEQQLRLLDPSADAAQISELMAKRDMLQKQMADLQRRYDELANRPRPPLPEPLDDALRDFARQNPELVEYDSAMGMVKFRSDVTFKLGSAELSDKAKATIAKLAPILNGTFAANYEARVVGHTDTVRIARPSTREAHPTNWYLSAHRAIAVRDELENAGVAALRTSVAGNSMYRPLVQNTPTGAEANRRVEIYLVPMPAVNERFLSGAGTAERSAPPSAQPAPTAAVETEKPDIPLK